MTFSPAPPVVPDTHRLTYADEEVVIRYRRGENPAAIAAVLGYTPQKVGWTLRRALAQGVSLRRGPA